MADDSAQGPLSLDVKGEGSFSSSVEDLHMEAESIDTPPISAERSSASAVSEEDAMAEENDADQSSASEGTTLEEDEISEPKASKSASDRKSISQRNLQILLTTPPQLPDKKKAACKVPKKALTLGERMTVIKLSEEGKSTRQIAQLLGVGRTQIQLTVKKKQEYIHNYNQNAPLEQRRQMRKTGNEIVNELCWQWYQEMTKRNIKVNGPMLKERALNFAAESGNKTFKASNGWLDSFLKRHNIAFGKVASEGGGRGSDPTVVADWKKKLKALCEGYEDKDIFNLDETGIFFKFGCEKSFYTKGQQCFRGERAGDRLTLMLCTNMIGEKEIVTVIGNLSLSRDLTDVNVQLLPVSFKLAYKSWMNSEIFISWITSFNNKMALQQRHIIMFLDNAPCHQYLQLSNIKLQYLPPNISCLLQPLHQGIIQDVKRNFRRKQLCSLTGDMEASPHVTAMELMKRADVVDAIYWIASAWNDISETAIQKCFLRCGFGKTSETSKMVVSVSKNDFATPPEFDRIAAELIGSTFSEMCVVDDDLAICNMNVDHWGHNPMEPDGDLEDEPVEFHRRPTFSEANEALKTLCKYAMSQGMNQIVDEVFTIQESLVLAKCNQRQRTIDEFLKSYI